MKKVQSNSEWQEWGKIDPLWGVASWAGKDRNGSNPWTAEEFYALGKSDWEDFLVHWQKYGIENQSCLEIGCGAGRLTMHIAKHFDRTHAIDVSHEMLAFAQNHIKSDSVSFAYTDGSTIPLSDNSVTAVFSTHVFQHFDSLGYAAHYFSEIARVLRPGGTTMLHLPIYNWPSDTAVFNSIYGFRKLLDDAKTALWRLLTKCGMKKPTMRGLRYPINFLYSTLPQHGLIDVEICIFRIKSNGELHPCVFARKQGISHLECMCDAAAEQNTSISDSANAAFIKFSLTRLPAHPMRQGEGGLRLKGKIRQSLPDQPLVTIVTVVYKCKQFLETAIRSALNQKYSNTEYIVIDGGSTDGTIDIIRKYEHAIDYWVSEPDSGISEAFNKGVMLAKGDYISFLNADDWLAEDQIDIAVQTLNKSRADFVFGDIIFHDFTGKPLYRIKGDLDYDKKIAHSMPDLNHPTVMARKAVYDKIGGFDLNYKIAMDYDWLLRGYLAGFRGLYVPDLIEHMRLCGVSDRRYAVAYREVRDISVRYGYSRAGAYCLYFYRFLRTTLKHCIQTILPTACIQRIREFVNPLYKRIK